MNVLSFVNTVYANAMVFTLVFTRIFLLFYTFSVLRREMATVKIILTLSMVLAFYVIMLYPISIQHEGMLSLPFFLQILIQSMIGFSAGLIMNISFEIFSSIGQILSSQIGLSTASLFDPKFGMITSLTNFYIMATVVIFFMMDGHLIMVEGIVKSFSTLPVNILLSQFNGIHIFQYASNIFSVSVMISMTVICAILMTNISLAVMSKFAPQFNLFSIGLNMSLLIGLLCIYFTFQLFVDKAIIALKYGLQYYQSYFILLAKP